MADLVITGARIIDPASGLDTAAATLYVQDGRIAHIGEHGSYPLGVAEGGRIINANECVMTPGLIDCHVHAYEHVTPLGLNLDGRCLSRGVTTAVDAGSAGCSTLPGLRKFIKEQSECRLFAFLHVAAHGLASAGCAGLFDGGEIDSLNVANVQGCVAAVKKNRDFVVGVKVRLTSSIADNGRNEAEAYRRALQAAREADVPLMVHHSISTVPSVKTQGMLSCPGDLRPGDIYTHALHFHKSGIISTETGRVYPDVWEAKRRGVLFDVGHGMGSFGWAVAEACAKEGFWPDLIGTDLHTESMEGPAYDLATVMTKIMHVGMSLEDVIAAVTSKAAAAIWKSKEIGSLQVGREADITILRVEACSMELEDAKGETRTIRKRIVPVRVFRAGVEHPILDVSPCPNSASKEKCLNSMKQYVSYAQQKTQ